MSQEKNLTHVFDPKDIQNNKVMSGFGYLIFFLPLIVMKDSKFARFHANQILLLLASQVVLGLVGGILMGIFGMLGLGIFVGLVAFVMWILLLILEVLAIINMIGAFQGKAKRIPVIGKMTIISNSNNMDAENMFQNQTLNRMADNLQNFSISAPMTACPGCGNRVLKGKKFCPKCGTAIPEIKEERKSVEKKCVQCGNELEANAKFCPECGTPVKEEKKIENCPNCHAKIKDGMKFCSECGTKIMEEA